MHINLKKVIATFSAMTMLITTISLNSITTVAAQDDIYATSGECGEKATWLINSDGVLVVSGQGELTDSIKSWGWKMMQESVNEVVIEDGITGASTFNPAFGFANCYNYSKITFPPSVTHLNGCLYDNSGLYTDLKDIYVYSRNITDAATLYNPHFTLYAGSGIIWHIYKGSQTENSLREGLHLNDEDIEYIPDDEEMPPVTNKEPVKLAPLTETSGPSGLNSKWEWNESNKTLTFSGKDAITISDYYKNYAEETEHIVMNSGIATIGRDDATNQSGAFYGFTALKDVKLPDTLKEIKDFSFYQTPINRIIDGLPEGLETIGKSAFRETNLSDEISFPKSLNIIHESAFANTKLKSINLHERMEIGGSAFQGCQLTELTIPKDIKFYRTNEGGQGMAREHGTFAANPALEKVRIEDGNIYTDAWKKVISNNALVLNFFNNCPSLKTVILGGNINYIPEKTFDDCPSLSDMYFYTPELSTIVSKGENDGKNESIDSDSDPTYYVIKGSKTEQTLKDAGYLTDDNIVYLATKEDINNLGDIISYAENFISKLTENDANKLKDTIDSAKSKIDKYEADNYSGITINEVNEAIKNINDIINNISADYTSVDEAIAKADKLDLSKYTDESVKALQDAINAVEKGLDITNQDKVDAFAKAIEDAIKGLVVKKTDSKPNKPNNSGTSKNPNVKPATSVSITTRSPSQVAKDKKNAKKKVNQAKITNLKAKSKSKKKITVSWKKVKKAVGYEVQVSKTRKFKKALFDKFTTKKKITFKKKLKSDKIYYVRVRAYATYKDAYGKPQKVYSKWIKKVRKVKVK